MGHFAHLPEQPRIQTAPGASMQPASGTQLMLCRGELQPGTTVAPHRHPAEQITLVIEGRMLFRVGDEERECGPWDVVVIPGDTVHSVHAPEGAVFIEAFAPVRLELLAGFLGRSTATQVPEARPAGSGA